MYTARARTAHTRTTQYTHAKHTPTPHTPSHPPGPTERDVKRFARLLKCSVVEAFPTNCFTHSANSLQKVTLSALCMPTSAQRRKTRTAASRRWKKLLEASWGENMTAGSPWAAFMTDSTLPDTVAKALNSGLRLHEATTKKEVGKAR
jgi:hypothetical protein